MGIKISGDRVSSGEATYITQQVESKDQLTELNDVNISLEVGETKKVLEYNHTSGKMELVKIGDNNVDALSIAKITSLQDTLDAKVDDTQLDTTASLGTDDTKIPSQKAVKSYADNLKSATETLTNKSIDSSNNTITNIVNADISATAAIAESKLNLDYATGTLNTAISALSGVLIYRGTHDCSTLAYPTDPATGDYWKCSVAGTISGVDYAVGDSMIYNGSTWDKIDNTNDELATHELDTSTHGVTGTILGSEDIDTTDTLGTSDSKIPSQKAVKTYVDNIPIISSAADVSIADAGDIITAEDVETALQENRGVIDSNTGSISTNAGNISTNAGNISSLAGTTSSNTGYISTNISNISTNAGNLSDHEAATVAHGTTGNILGTEDIVDEDDMTSNSNTKIPTQQSVKAYVDNAVAAGISYQDAVESYVASAPTPGDYTNGDLYINSTDKKVYTLVGGAWDSGTTPSTGDTRFCRDNGNTYSYNGSAWSVIAESFMSEHDHSLGSPEGQISFDNLTDKPVGSDIGITDTGDYYTGENVETILQEIGATLISNSGNNIVSGKLFGNNEGIGYYLLTPLSNDYVIFRATCPSATATVKVVFVFKWDTSPGSAQDIEAFWESIADGGTILEQPTTNNTTASAANQSAGVRDTIELTITTKAVGNTITALLDVDGVDIGANLQIVDAYLLVS